MLVEGATLLLAAGTLLTGLSLAASRGLPWLALSLASVLPIAIWRLREPGRRATNRLSEPSVRQPHVSLLLETAAFGGASFVLPFLLGASVVGSTRTVGITLLALPLASIMGSAVGGMLADRSTPRAAAILGATRGKGGVVGLGGGQQPRRGGAERRGAILADGAAQEHPGALLAPFGKARVAQDANMARDARLALPQHLRELPHRELHVREQAHNAQPGAVSERAQEGIDLHCEQNIKKSLYDCNGRTLHWKVARFALIGPLH